MKNLYNFKQNDSVFFENKFVYFSPGETPRGPEVTKEQTRLMKRADKMVPDVAKFFLKDKPGSNLKQKANNFMTKYEKKPGGDVARVDEIKSWLQSFRRKSGDRPFNSHDRGVLSFYTREYSSKIDSAISKAAYAPIANKRKRPRKRA